MVPTTRDCFEHRLQALEDLLGSERRIAIALTTIEVVISERVSALDTPLTDPSGLTHLVLALCSFER